MPEQVQVSEKPGVLPGAVAAARLEEGPVGSRRYLIAVLLLLMITVAYVDRMLFCGGTRPPCSWLAGRWIASACVSSYR